MGCDGGSISPPLPMKWTAVATFIAILREQPLTPLHRFMASTSYMMERAPYSFTGLVLEFRKPL